MATLTPSPKMQFFDNNGIPLSGGKLYTYAAGTTTPLATYTDSTAGTPNTNPIILNSRGEASVWLGDSLYYMELKTSTDTLIWSADNVGGIATANSVSRMAVTLTNIAALRATAVSSTYDAITKGYYTAGDGGHGEYYGVTGAAAGTYVDNACTIIVPTGGNGSSAWLLKHDGKINILQAGAQPNVDSTTAIQTVINTQNLVYIPRSASPFLYTNLVFNANAAGMVGDGMYASVLQPTAVAGNSIIISASSICAWAIFENFGINGNGTTTTGIKLGTSRTPSLYTCNLSFTKVRIESFSATNARGVILQCCQDIDFNDCVIQRNYTNIYRPDTSTADGYATTIRIDGKSSSLDLSSGPASVLADGSIANIIIGPVTIRSCQQDAIRFNTPVGTSSGEGNELTLLGTYFEQNNLAGTGVAEINITGRAGAQNELSFSAIGLDFHAQAIAYQQLKTDNVVGTVKDCLYLNTAKITTTANSKIFFENNNLLSKWSTDAKTGYGALLGTIAASDQNYFDSHFFERGSRQFVDGLRLGLDEPNAIANTAKGMQIVTGNMVYGDCTAPVSKALFRLYCQNDAQGRRDNTSAVYIFWRANQTSDSARSRGACGLLMAASLDPSAAVGVTPNVSLTSSVPTASDGNSFTIAAYSATGGTPSNTYTTETTYVDAGITITSSGAQNTTGSVSVSYVALICGNVTQL